MIDEYSPRHLKEGWRSGGAVDWRGGGDDRASVGLPPAARASTVAQSDLSPCPPGAARSEDQYGHFDFDGQYVLRTITIDGEPWFRCDDLCDAFEYMQGHQVVHHLPDHDWGNIRWRDQGPTIIVSEPGMWRLLFKSKSPRAGAIQDWLYRVVLPQLRRTGQYQTSAAVAAPTSELQILQAAINTLVAQEGRIAANERATVANGIEADRANQRIDKFENPDHRATARHYAVANGFPTDNVRTPLHPTGYLNEVGTRASQIARDMGLKPHKIAHDDYGTVNTWPPYVWQRAFEEIHDDV